MLQVLGDLGLSPGGMRETRKKKKHHTVVTRPHDRHVFRHCVHLVESALAVSFEWVCVCNKSMFCKHSLCTEEKKIAT